MGEIYEELKKPEQAITSYQQSFKLNSRQNDLIKKSERIPHCEILSFLLIFFVLVCRLFLISDGWASSLGKAKYWCELADTENVCDDNVSSLRLKVLGKDKNGGKPVEDIARGPQHLNNISNGNTEKENVHTTSANYVHGRRDALDSANYNENFTEVGTLITKLTDLVVSTKENVLNVRNDITDLKDELLLSNISQNGQTDEESFHNASSTSFHGRRDVSGSANYSKNFAEVEAIISKLADLVASTKDDILCVRNDITDVKDELLNVRGDIADMNVNRDTLTTKALTDVFKAIEELSCNISYLMNLGPNATSPAARFPPNLIQAHLNQMYSTAYPMSAYPMQYPTPSMMQRPPPPPVGHPAAHLQYDPMGQNLMMNSQAVTLALQANAQKSSLMEALNTPTLLNTWNNTYNQQSPLTPPNFTMHPPPVVPIATKAPIQNKPVEKDPPVNVVITKSDPLPSQNSSVSQPTLSVTIPPQHIKNPPQPMFYQQPIVSSVASNAPQYENISPSRNDGNEYLEEPADYDPRPDFKAIIPLPDEVIIKTGEEDEDVVFSDRCKLFRNADSEWKERGIGTIKILKNKQTGTYRIVMRRELIHKICANHGLTAELKLKTTAKPTSLIWGAEDFSEEQMQLEKFLVRFKTADQANKFKEAFESAQKLAPKTPLQEKKNNIKTKDNVPKVIHSFRYEANILQFPLIHS